MKILKKNQFQLFRSTFILGISAIVNYLITFLITPFITENIGIEAYGFVTLAKTVVSYAQIFTIALTSFTVRYIFVSYHSGKLKEAKEYFSSAVAGCLIFAGIVCIPLLLGDLKLEFFLNIPVDMRTQVKMLFALVFLNFFFNTLVTPFSSYAHLANRLDISGLITLISYLTDAVVLVLLFSLFSPQIWFVGIGTLTATLVLLGSSIRMTHRYVPELRFERKLIRLDRIKELIRSGIWNSFNSVGDVLNSGLDLLITNLLLTDIVMGQVSVAKTLGIMVRGAYGILFQPFQPRLLKAYTDMDKPRLINEIRKAMFVGGCFANIIVAGFLALGNLYYRLWMPSQDYDMLYKLTAIIVINGLTTGMIQPVYYVYTLTVQNKIPCIVTIGGGFLNVVSMFVLLKSTGLGGYAVVGTTTVIMVVLNLTFNILYAAKCLQVSSQQIYRAVLLNFFSAGIMVCLFKELALFIRPSGWISLIGTAICMTVIGVLVHVILCKTDAMLGKK